MVITFNLIDGGTRDITFRAPKQSACLDYTIAVAELGETAEGASTAEQMRKVRDAYGAALGFLVAHCDVDRDWYDDNVQAFHVVSAADRLLGSRNPTPESVGKSEAGPA